MPSGKTEKARRERLGQTGDGMGNVKVKGENFYRNSKKVKLLNMYKEGKPIRDKNGKIIKEAPFQSKEIPNAVIEPNRRWFNNTRVISQDTLVQFRDAVQQKDRDPYSVLLKSNKLPMSLIRDNNNKRDENGMIQHVAKMAIETAPYVEVFGPKAQRKRVRLNATSIKELAGETDRSMETYKERQEQLRFLCGKSGLAAGNGEEPREVVDEAAPEAVDPIFHKGKSKRIYNELYKVIDASDVILMVLDARDPLGTRCFAVEKFLNKEAPHKHIVFVLNKIDLVPTKTAAAWVKYLQRTYPTCAMRSSVTSPFGRGSLIDLLRQFSILHKDRKEISCGLIGYPNVGKSSVLNALRGKKVATVAPIPGETKVWQYVSLMKRINLIDCPGVVPPNAQDKPADLLLRGVVRVENVSSPSMYLPALMKRVKSHHLSRTYSVKEYGTWEELLEQIARKAGRLLKAGEPDMDGAAKMLINDFLRGKLPWYTPAPALDENDAMMEGRMGVFGEISKKRKREELEIMPDTSMGGPSNEGSEDGDTEDVFDGFEAEDEVKAEGSEVAATEMTEVNKESRKEKAEDFIALGGSSDEEGEFEYESGTDEFEDGSDNEEDAGLTSSAKCRTKSRWAV